jgi:hypothetical protein
MAAALMNHQITELENRVNGIHFPKPGVIPIGADGNSGRAAEDRQHGSGKQGAENGKGAEKGEVGNWRVAVLDVSALMWAPKIIKEVVNRGWEVIVPLEGESCILSINYLPAHLDYTRITLSN